MDESKHGSEKDLLIHIYSQQKALFYGTLAGNAKSER
jgi:hypothetical protein